MSTDKWLMSMDKWLMSTDRSLESVAASPVSADQGAGFPGSPSPGALRDCGRDRRRSA